MKKKDVRGGTGNPVRRAGGSRSCGRNRKQQQFSVWKNVPIWLGKIRFGRLFSLRCSADRLADRLWWSDVAGNGKLVFLSPAGPINSQVYFGICTVVRFLLVKGKNNEGHPFFA